MQVLKIFRSNLELLTIHLRSPSIVIGRSPLCDEILRAPGVKPVHFLLEWVGETAFKPEQGFWTLYDISVADSPTGGEAASFAEMSSEGVIVGESGALLQGFHFVWSQDRLSEAQFEKGAIGEALMDQYLDQNEIQSEHKVFEIARFDRQDQVLIDIVHQRGHLDQARRLPRVPEIALKWQSPNQAEVMVNKGVVLDAVSLKTKTKYLGGKENALLVNADDIIKLSTDKYELYLRFVQKIAVERAPREFLKDKFYLLAGIFIVVSVVMVITIGRFDFTPQVESSKKNERIVTVYEEPQAEQPVPEVVVPLSPPKVIEEQKSSVAVAPVVKTKRAPQKTGLNSPAEVKDINAVGLLGKLKSKATAAAAIDAADLAQTYATDAAKGDEGRVVLSQQKMGVIDLNSPSTQTSDVNALNEASTTLQGATEYDPQSGGPIANNQGVKGEYSLGLGVGATATQHLSQGKGSGPIGLEKIIGGLDRIAVRKQIAEQRREIRTCFESALSVRNDLKGTMVFRWNISPEGEVTSIKLESSELKSELAEGCVMNVLRTIRYPKSPNGQPTVVIYPFIFQKS